MQIEDIVITDELITFAKEHADEILKMEIFNSQLGKRVECPDINCEDCLIDHIARTYRKMDIKLTDGHCSCAYWLLVMKYILDPSSVLEQLL